MWINAYVTAVKTGAKELQKPKSMEIVSEVCKQNKWNRDAFRPISPLCVLILCFCSPYVQKFWSGVWGQVEEVDSDS